VKFENIPIISAGVKRGPSEACVSFSRKVNLENYGGPRYESAEFFASRKVQCTPEDLEALSVELHEECVQEVEAQARQYVLDVVRKQKEFEKRQAEKERQRKVG
jgi:hypothetical protein